MIATAREKPKRKRRYTEQDLLSMPDDGRKYELVDGRIQVVPTGGRHGWLGAKLSGMIYAMLPDFRVRVGELFK